MLDALGHGPDECPEAELRLGVVDFLEVCEHLFDFAVLDYCEHS